MSNLSVEQVVRAPMLLRATNRGLSKITQHRSTQVAGYMHAKRNSKTLATVPRRFEQGF